MRKILIICMVFVSCSPSKKAHKYFDEHRNEFAKDCSDAYPVRDSIVVKDSVSTDTFYLPNEEWWKLDTVTVYQKGDSVHVPCPQRTIITRTVTHDSVIFRENTAKVSYLEDQLKIRDSQISVLKDNLQRATSERDSFKSKAHKYFWWLIILVAGVLVWIFRKPIAEFIGTLLKTV